MLGSTSLRSKCPMVGIFVLLLTTLLQGCISTDRFTRIVRQKLTQIDSVQSPLYVPYLSLATDNLYIQDSIAQVKKVKATFLPLVLYWERTQLLKCMIRQDVPVRIFRRELARLADSLSLQTALKDMKLELSLDSFPSGFFYSHRNQAYFPLFDFVVFETNLMTPDIEVLKVNYRVLDHSTSVMRGVVTIPCFELYQRMRAQSKANFSDPTWKITRPSIAILHVVF